MLELQIKVSWKRSSESVRKECSILQSLASIPHVERCIGQPMDYSYEDGRTIIALSPVVMSSHVNDEDDGGIITSNLDKVRTGIPQKERHEVRRGNYGQDA